MLEVDLHTHTFFSACGIHTHLEILTRAKALGMTAVAITDHGSALSPRVSSPFFDRLNHPLDGIRLLKGMECNLLNDKGEIDLEPERLRYLDVVLLGIHPNTPRGLGEAAYTDMMLAAIQKNAAIDILTHLNDESYPVRFEAVIEAATARGIAIELNNSKTLLRRSPDSLTRKLISVSKTKGARMVITSDMHAIEELGADSAVKPFLIEQDFPIERVVSSSAASAFAFIEERRFNKK
jgi:putative hydrolase